MITKFVLRYLPTNKTYLSQFYDTVGQANSAIKNRGYKIEEYSIDEYELRFTTSHIPTPRKPR